MCSDRLAALAACFALAGCQSIRTSPPGPERLAFINFEDLSPTPDSAWIGPALAFVAAGQLSAARGILVRHFPDPRSAAAFQPARTVSGYYTAGDDGIRFHVWLRDGSSGRTDRILELSAATPDELPAIADRLARDSGREPRPPLTRNSQALRSLGDALTNPAPEGRIAALEAAIAADQAFDEARLLLAREYTAAQRHPDAAAVFAILANRHPGVGLYWNELAYAQARTGRFEAALESLSHYAQLDSGPNPLDSRGEIQFMARQYADAAASFQAAYEKNPAFLNGAPLRKAAEASLHAGKTAEATVLFERFLDGHAKEEVQQATLRARWRQLLEGQQEAGRGRP